MKSDKAPKDHPEWLDILDAGDLAFIRRFVMASGSLKELARVYNISYPTVRLRLDRLIGKLNIHETYRSSGYLEKRLRILLGEGRITSGDFKVLMEAYRKDMEENRE